MLNAVIGVNGGPESLYQQPRSNKDTKEGERPTQPHLRACLHLLTKDLSLVPLLNDLTVPRVSGIDRAANLWVYFTFKL